MARTVNCVKLKREAGLDFPPYPGELGTSGKAFPGSLGKWKQVQTRLVNETRLNPGNPAATPEAHRQ